jgi:hexulose-6-phosphate isomerase
MDASINRREWIHTAAVATAGMMTAANVSAQDKKGANLEGRIFKAVKGGGPKKGQTVTQFFQQLKDLGFDGVESGNASIAAEYREATEATGIMFHGRVCGWHWKTRLSSPDEAVRKKGVEMLERDIRDTHTLGGSAVLLVPGKVTGASETHDDVWNRSITEVKPLLPLASRLGVRILIETVWNGFCYDPEKFRDYIDAFESPWVGAYFDIGNMQKFAPAEEWIRTLGTRNVKLDIKDWGKKPGFCRLGDGDVDWNKVRDALKEVGFSGWATREGRDKDLTDTSRLIDQLLIGKA